MQTRREQVQAYRFVTRRIVSALLSGEPETNNMPMRRLGMAVFGSVMLGAIVLAVVGVYGLVTKGGAPLEPNSLVIERETGAKYVFMNDRLNPVLNYASARLVLGEPDPPIRTVSQASLKDRPRGRMIGILDAPDALPDRSALLGLPWLVCNAPSGADPSRPSTRLVIDQELAGSSSLAKQALLVISGETRYLLWNNTRMKVAGGRPALAALGLASVRAIPVGPQFINAVPAGPNLQTLAVPGAGEQSSRRIAGGPAWIGQIFRANGQHYVMTRDGLAPISEINAKLRVAGGGGIKDITAEQAGTALSGARLEPEGFPQAIPQLHQTATAQPAICATYRAGAGPGKLTTTIEVFDPVPPELSPTSPGSVEVRQTARDAVSTIEQVIIPGGQGVIAQGTSGAGDLAGDATGSTVYLITDQGIRYPLGKRSGDAQQSLGYAGVTPLAVPASVLALIPVGPTLDPEAAKKRFVPADGGVPAKPTATPTGTPRGAPTATPTGTPSGSPVPDSSASGTPSSQPSNTPAGSNN
jgi:type VII secretion protein EccB